MDAREAAFCVCVCVCVCDGVTEGEGETVGAREAETYACADARG